MLRCKWFSHRVGQKPMRSKILWNWNGKSGNYDTKVIKFLLATILEKDFCVMSTEGNQLNQRPYPLDETLDERRTDGTNGASNEIIVGGRELKPIERLLPEKMINKR